MKKVLFLILIVIIVSVVWTGKIILVSQGGSNEVQNFKIEEGQSVSEIANNLKEQDLVSNLFVWQNYLKLTRSANKLQSGNHFLSANMSLAKITRVLVSQPRKEELDITIIEGWNIYEIAEYLENQELIENQEVFLKSVSNLKAWTPEYDFLNVLNTDNTLEGFLFPDTYRVYKETTADAIITKMLDNFENKIEPLKDQISNNQMDLKEILTLASIVEKEARTESDMRLVADVYLKRLDGNTMRLQSDPTVNYVTGKRTDRPTLDDTFVESPYNTYRNDGLPPGPICNPSLTAIKAVLDPIKNDYYFFINTPDGEMVYSRNFEEHQQNREKYFNN